MTHGFDKDFWERHWTQGQDGGTGSMGGNPPNPYLAREISGLTPGTALDAGCGGGAEAIWLASHGWHVTAADISSAALARAAERAAASGAPERLQWVEEDLSVWSPGAQFDLVMTHYAHPAMPQLEFYDRIAGWVTPGGTLLIVGHLHTPDSPGHGHHPCRSVGHLRGHHRAPGRHGVGDRHRRRAPPHAHRPRRPSGSPPGCRRARHPTPIITPSDSAGAHCPGADSPCLLERNPMSTDRSSGRPGEPAVALRPAGRARRRRRRHGAAIHPELARGVRARVRRRRFAVIRGRAGRARLLPPRGPRTRLDRARDAAEPPRRCHRRRRIRGMGTAPAGSTPRRPPVPRARSREWFRNSWSFRQPAGPITRRESISSSV